jgi:hypothetical protein
LSTALSLGALVSALTTIIAAALAHLAIPVIPATIVTIIAMFMSGLLKLGVNILVLVFTVVLIIVSIIYRGF